MQTKVAEFTQLIDQAAELAQSMNTQNPSEYLNHLMSALQTLKNQALEGQLEPSQGTVTLGLSRQVADQIGSLDSPLLKAVGAIESYYQDNF